MKYALVTYFVVSVALLLFHYRNDLDLALDLTSDLYIFTTAASIVSDGGSENLYALHERGNLQPFQTVIVGHFFNPPGFILPYLAIEPLEPQEQRIAVLVIGIVALAVLVLLSDSPPLAAAVLLASAPLYLSFMLGQPSAVFALLTALTLKRPLLASLLALKPTLFLGAAVAIARHHRDKLGPLAIATAVVFLGPFVIGARIDDYVSLVSKAGNDGLLVVGEESAGASDMMGWPGFWGRILTADVPFVLHAVSAVVTLAIAAVVLIRRDFVTSFFACTLAVLLVSTHAHAHDWLVLVPIALAMKRDRETVLLLLALHLALNLSAVQNDFSSETPGFAVYPAAPVGLATLVWLAFGESIRAAFGRRRIIATQTEPASP